MADTFHAAFHRPGTTVHRVVDACIWVLIVASVGLFVAELGVFGVHSDAHTALRVVDRVILGLFVVEYVLRVLTYRPPELALFKLSEPQRLRHHLRGRLRFMVRPIMLVDLVTVLAFVPELRGLRAVRLLRLLRTAGAFPYAKPFERIARTFYEHRLPFYFALSLLGIEVVIGGLSVYLVEAPDHVQIKSLGDGLWWALVTLTTVGYGDMTPVSGLGRIIGGCLMVGGMFTLALFAGIVGHTFLNTLILLREEQHRMTEYVNHVIICGYTAAAHSLLTQIQRELGVDTQIIVIAPTERDPSVPPEVTWVIGDPTKEVELEKIRPTHATRAVVVAQHQLPTQQADAVTLMTIFTLRAYLRKHAATGERRQERLWIVAELLEAENVEHAKAAGADEIIESITVGYAMIAHAVSEPGSATILSRVATLGALNIYVGRQPPRLTPAECTFGALRHHLKANYDALLIGTRDGVTHVETLNPPDATLISETAQLVYLATRSVLPRLT